MDERLAGLLDEFMAAGLRAVPSCSYAVRWFGEHPERAGLLAGPRA